MNSPKILSADESVNNGMIGIADKQMPNDELRFYRIHQDGSGYIRTEGVDDKAVWQNSHYHKTTYEWYAVQEGEITLAFLDKDGQLQLKLMKANDTHQFNPGVHHNVLMGANAKIHTVKFGSIEPNDWHSSPELDALTKDKL